MKNPVNHANSSIILLRSIARTIWCTAVVAKCLNSRETSNVVVDGDRWTVRRAVSEVIFKKVERGCGSTDAG